MHQLKSWNDYYSNTTKLLLMQIATTRMETFSDGVIAIIITIMVLELKLPVFGTDDTSIEIERHLLKLTPYLLAYLFSFMMIGIYWTNHHHLFHLLENTDEGLLWLNMAFLFCISLIPLATALIGTNPRLTVSTIVYGSVMLMTTLTLTWMRSYSLRKNLLHRDRDKKLTRSIYYVSRRGRTKSIVGTLCYLVSIPLSLINIYIAYVCFIIPALIFFIPDGVDGELLAEKVEEKKASSATAANN